MPNFPPIDWDISMPDPRFPNDPEALRRVRDVLAALHDDYVDTHDFPNCWDYTMYRTAYAPDCDDEKFAAAIKRLDSYANDYVFEDIHDHDIQARDLPSFQVPEPLDPTPNRELWSRYYNEVVQDPATLSGADYVEVARRFKAWIKEHFHPSSPEAALAPNSRYRVFLMLDKESIEGLLALPEDPTVGQEEKFSRGIKVVALGDHPCGEEDDPWSFRAMVGMVWRLWYDIMDGDMPCVGDMVTANDVDNAWELLR